MSDWFIDIVSYNAERPMLFTQLYFWIFMAITLAFYSFVYKTNRVRNVYLLVLSLFFYYKSGGYFFVLLLFTTTIDYAIGIAIGTSTSQLKRRVLVIFSVLLNLTVLAYFKYSYLINDVINHLTGLNLTPYNFLADFSNSITGSHFNINAIILPVGISFYTFQSLSYTIDVYRKDCEPVRNFADFAFFVTFFPQLVAGPIVRASQFIPQLFYKYSLSKAELGHAIFLILNGLIKKMLISDYISINFVDRVFDSPESYTGLENLMAVYGYAIQIYCDFSGYTDIAIGIAQILGFKLPVNFYSPYKASSITDFWRRWHISLSTWLRDYLYIPLGGNRKGKFRSNLNLFLTMLLGGLWHGANWSFMIWGGMHGLGLIIHKVWMQINPFKNKNYKILDLFFVIVTLHFVSFLWIFFRVENLDRALFMLVRIFTAQSFDSLPLVFSAYWNIVLLIFIAFVIHWIPETMKEKYRGLFIRIPMIAKIAIVVIVVFGLYQIKSSELQPFIYFQF